MGAVIIYHRSQGEVRKIRDDISIIECFDSTAVLNSAPSVIHVFAPLQPGIPLMVIMKKGHNVANCAPYPQPCSPLLRNIGSNPQGLSNVDLPKVAEFVCRTRLTNRPSKPSNASGDIEEWGHSLETRRKSATFASSRSRLPELYEYGAKDTPHILSYPVFVASKMEMNNDEEALRQSV
ncbi:predicted protein [Histoplasma mississippiense (nom. inval.)]|uniref:predicted protein n=1 Tax=Ajellomyces capsulatus (strain NAm1 / WU24) TaxID=2059318 RepID=UPI000157D20C|nr:predicted protein [Histoplasma mississippiense (nom. inval.)]EDN04981.1 predicted protein [Histoplasma mississippiense (nom. inval.)]